MRVNADWAERLQSGERSSPGGRTDESEHRRRDWP